MKAVVHIGTEKTGSTSIQNFLFHNRSVLAEQGFHFGAFGRDTDVELAAFAKQGRYKEWLYRRFQISDGPAWLAWKEHFREDFEKRLTSLDESCRVVIFSSEHLSSYLQTRNEVQNLKALLDEYFDEVEILVYLRRQDMLLVSRFNEFLKYGGYRRSLLPPPSSVNPQIYDYNRLVSLWGGVFGSERLIVRNFDTATFVNNQLIDDALAQLEIDYKPEQFVELERPSNQRLSGDAQRALMVCNFIVNTLGLPRASPRIRSMRLRLIETFQSSKLTRAKNLSREEAQKFYGLFSESNRQLAQALGKPGEFFELDFSMYPPGRRSF